jgi:hypothetical protein
MAHGNTKDNLRLFVERTEVKRILGPNYPLTQDQQDNIIKFFDHYPDRDRSGVWRKNIAIWIMHDLGDWINRRKLLSNVTSNSKEWFDLMYGPEKGKVLFGEFVSAKRKLIKNTLDYWVSRGYSIDEAQAQVREIQKARGKKAGKKLKGTSEYSIRSKHYWIKHGKTEDEAIKMVSALQRRDLDFYVAKYGTEDGITAYNTSVQKRRQTWTTKDKLDHAIKTTPPNFNPNGQEMTAIRGFMSSNKINPACCKFGAPNQQFWQNIPGVGYRRYDLAVFADITHTVLKYVVEFHGPGHINFSDYDPLLKDEPITINGKKLLHLGTYGAAVANDKAKKEHILKMFPSAIYLVIWGDDLINKRFLINDLLSKRQ